MNDKCSHRQESLIFKMKIKRNQNKEIHVKQLCMECDQFTNMLKCDANLFFY